MRRAAIAFASVVTLLVTAPALAQVARVVSVQGIVALDRAGQPPRILGPGDGLEEKDVITVAQTSHGILEFRDKTRVTLRPSTIFRVESYADTGEQSLVLGLTKGGFRAVSGDIAKKSPTAMRVQTSTTILGVRGTEFDARICEGDCGAGDAADGLYVWVRDGVVMLGTLEVFAGQAAVADKDGFKLLAIVPGFMRIDLTPRPGVPPPPFMLRVFSGPDGSTVNMCIGK